MNESYKTMIIDSNWESDYEYRSAYSQDDAAASMDDKLEYEFFFSTK
ncbi:hypothetical protein PCURB6_06220 [Paenibacillus curdlanolyticus]|nr:hypothetical protein PCURB6_06220 [Paenibacillus curdlanolyticus]